MSVIHQANAEAAAPIPVAKYIQAKALWTGFGKQVQRSLQKLYRQTTQIAPQGVQEAPSKVSESFAAPYPSLPT